MKITIAERDRFHTMLDESLDNENNSNHVHWTKLDLFALQESLNRKEKKLNAAIRIMKKDDMVTVCYEYANTALMIADNLRGNKE